jgi:glyoxylase-like metal-dependent hydrolase (beta-lactamase superfamily II)
MISVKLDRREFLLSASILSAGPLVAGQTGQDFSKVQIKVTPVSGSVYMLQGEGGNIVASVGDDGIAIVDDQFAPLAGKIRAALRDITGKDKPVRFVINTHYHGDHTGGNPNFGGASTIIAQDNVRKRLAAGGPQGNGGSIHAENQPAPKVALPIITFARDVTVHLNGEDIRALHFPAGHTDGDSIIFYPHANVVHMGDDFVRYAFPFIDIVCGGSVQGMIAACDKVIRQVPSDVKIIPGHGDLSSLDDVRAYLEMLQGTTDAVQKALQQGKTMAEMKQQNILAPWHKFAAGFIKEDGHIETVYNSLTGKNTGKFVKHN